MKNINTKSQAWLNIMAFFLTLAFNTLGALGYINGMSQKAISNKYHTLITPAPLTFSIWSLIYLLILWSLIRMVQKEKDPNVKKLIHLFTPVFLWSSLFNILWIVTFSYEKIGLSTILIFALLISVTTINKRLFEHRQEVTSRLTGLAFGLYAGWLTIATVLNIAVYLVSIRWEAFGISPRIWAPVILLIAVGIVILINMQLNNGIYYLPVAWAFFGILMEGNRVGEDIKDRLFMKPVILLGIAILLFLTIRLWKKNNFWIIGKQSL